MKERRRIRWLPAVLTLCLSLPLAMAQGRRGPTLVPAIDHDSRSTSEWLSKLRESGGRSREALWCAYHSCSPSSRDEVVEALLDLLKDELTPWMRRDVETILGRWGDGFEVRDDLPERDERPRAFGGTIPEELRAFVDASDRVAVPSGVEGLSSEKLEEALASEDPVAQASAGVVLGWDPERSASIVQRLMRSLHRAGDEVAEPGTFMLLTLSEDQTGALVPRNWARSRAISLIHTRVGTRASRALLELVVEPDVEEGLRLAAWKQLTWTSDRVAGWLELLPQYGIEAVLPPRAIWTAIPRVYRFWSMDQAPVLEHLLDETSISRAVEELLVRCLRRTVEEWERRAPLSDEIDTIGWLGVRSLRARGSLRDTLLSTAVRRDALGLRAIYWLAAWEELAPDWEELYLSALETADFTDRTTLEWFPRVRGHTQRTLEAFRRAYERATDKRPLLRAVVAAEEGSEGERALSAGLLARLGPDDSWWWYEAFAAGLRGNPSIERSDGAAVQACKLGLQIRWKREHEEDPTLAIRELAELATDESAETTGGPDDPNRTAFSVLAKLGARDEELVDWCLQALSEPWRPDSIDRDDYLPYLLDIPLTRAEQARSYLVAEGEEGLSEDLMKLLARQGEAAIEWAGRIRLQAERSWIGDFRYAIEISGPNARDERVLSKALRSDSVERRLEALRIMDEYGLSSEELEEALSTCREDPDERVRRLAGA